MSIQAQLRKVLRTTGPGHSLEDLHELGFPDGTRAHLEELQRRGEATRFGKYWWLKVKEPKTYPKPEPPPPPQPIRAALATAGIREERGHAIKRTPRKP